MTYILLCSHDRLEKVDVHSVHLREVSVTLLTEEVVQFSLSAHLLQQFVHIHFLSPGLLLHLLCLRHAVEILLF